MRSNQKRYTYLIKIAGSAVVLIVMFSLAMLLGAKEVTLHEFWLVLTGQGQDGKLRTLWEIRYPREVAAMLVGAALAVAGAIMQGLTRNPLADPGLLGLTAGANAALAVAIALLPKMNYLGITVTCFVGAALGMLLVIGLGSLRKGGLSPMRIVLAGAAVSAFLYAVADGIGILFKTSKDVTMWTAAGLLGTTWGHVQTISPIVIGCILIAIVMSRQLTILSLNEETAVGLGLRTTTVKSVLYLLIVLLAGASVAIVGNMVFVGLMIPHIVRTLFGADYRVIVPMAVVWGAALMLLADTLGRTIQVPFEKPVVAIIAIIGLPFFLYIVRKGVKPLS